MSSVYDEAVGETRFSVTGVPSGRRQCRHHRQAPVGHCRIKTRRHTDRGKVSCGHRGRCRPKAHPGPEAREASKGRPLEASKRAQPCQHLHLIVPASRLQASTFPCLEPPFGAVLDSSRDRDPEPALWEGSSQHELHRHFQMHGDDKARSPPLGLGGEGDTTGGPPPRMVSRKGCWAAGSAGSDIPARRCPLCPLCPRL